jgi:hypothetical protein
VTAWTICDRHFDAFGSLVLVEESANGTCVACDQLDEIGELERAVSDFEELEAAYHQKVKRK